MGKLGWFMSRHTLADTRTVSSLVLSAQSTTEDYIRAIGESAGLVIERLRDQIAAGAAENFLLQSQLCVLTLIRCPCHPRVTAVAGKKPGHSAKSAGGRLHLNTHTPLTQRSRSELTMPISRRSAGTYPETAHTQIVREHSATVVSVRLATVD